MQELLVTISCLEITAVRVISVPKANVMIY